MYELVTTCTGRHIDSGHVLPKRYNSKFIALLSLIIRFTEEEKSHDMNLHGAPFISLVDSGLAKRRRDRTPTHVLVARASVHEDGGRNHNAPLEHFVLCDTGFDSSGSWCTRRCEVICIGDRDDADQIRVIQADENPNAW